MLKDNKGFTLVESIVTIAIFAIAGLILVTGFSTVIRYMGEATQIKDVSQKAYSELEKNVDFDSVKSSKVTIKIEGNVTIHDTIKYSEMSKPLSLTESFKVRYHKFELGNAEDNSKSVYEAFLKAFEEWKALTREEAITNFDKAKEELGISTNLPGGANDSFRWYYYVVNAVGNYYPEVSPKIIEKANEIFDSMNPNFSKSQARIGDKKLYMQPYYLVKTNKIIMSAVENGATASSTGGWRARLIFNPEDMNWYYKVFIAKDNQDGEDAFFPLTNFTSSGEGDLEVWKQLTQDFKDASIWRKIELD